MNDSFFIQLIFYVNGCLTLQIFLQSDIEPVALRMKELFIVYGKGKLLVMDDGNDVDGRGWLKENPFGVRSDWEQHVVDRGAPMYRLMLSKAMPM